MKLTDIANSLSGINKDYVSSLTNIESGAQDGNMAQKDNKNSFANILKNSIEDVNRSQVEAYDAMNDIATGKVDNLQEAVRTIEEAEMALKLGLEVKNKALGAYKQIMAMQV